MPPLSLRIHLVPSDDGSCHLGGHRGARPSSEPVVRACGTEKVCRRVEGTGSARDAWRHAGDCEIRSSGGDKVGSHLIHLTYVANSFVPVAPCACRSRSVGEHGAVHDERAVVDALLRLHEVLQRRSSTLHRVAHAHRQQLNAASATRCAAQQTWPQSSIPPNFNGTRHGEKQCWGALRVCMDGRGFVGRHLQAAEHGGHEVVNRLGVEASMEKNGEAQGCWCRIPCQLGVKQVVCRAMGRRPDGNRYNKRDLTRK